MYDVPKVMHPQGYRQMASKRDLFKRVKGTEENSSLNEGQLNQSDSENDPNTKVLKGF